MVFSVSMLGMAYLMSLLFLLMRGLASANNAFIFNQNFTLDLKGSAELSTEGLLRLTNPAPYKTGYAFYPHPFAFKNASNGNAFSFSTVFVFAIVPYPPDFPVSADGMAFFVSPAKEIDGQKTAGRQLGLFNRTAPENSSKHVIAIELDTFMNDEVGDIDSNHVGIDITNITSVKSASAGYYVDGKLKTLELASGDPIQAWVDYDGIGKQLNVTLAPLLNGKKPSEPLISEKIDLSSYILNQMYVGFSASTGTLLQSSYLLGWSFKMNGIAPELDLSKLPSLPDRKKPNRKHKLLVILLPVMASVLVLLTAIFLILHLLKRKSKFAEVLEDWEVKYGPHRFCYKDLYRATKGFSAKEHLGRGGFGQVYRGVLPRLKIQVAVKRISHNSAQGMKEFVAEIATIGRIRHPNLVRLLGYCRREGELFLVYDYMPNTSLDKFIFDNPTTSLNWDQRFNIIKDVASSLTYLHEEWVEVIIHRDIKASNVLLDGELHGKLGDFGLARSLLPGNDVHTTQLAGTLGYIAPELTINGKSTTATDVFAFGTFCFEVACGRRPVEPDSPPGEVILLEWVAECWKNGEILQTADPKLGNEFQVEQMKTVLKIGLLCTHFVPKFRPNMSQVKGYLCGHALEDLDNMLTDENWTHPKDLYVLTSRATEASISETKESMASVSFSDMFITTGR